MEQLKYSIVLEPEEGGAYRRNRTRPAGLFHPRLDGSEAMEWAAEAVSVHIVGLEAVGANSRPDRRVFLA